MSSEYRFTHWTDRDHSVNVHQLAIFNRRAELARDLLKQLAICSAEPDGEDAAGRQKLKLLTPERCAERACDIADRTLAEFEKRGWLISLPQDLKPAPRPKKGEDGGPDL